MGWIGGLIDWLDSRTGVRTARRHLLEEPLPPGVGWWFVTGSVFRTSFRTGFASGSISSSPCIAILMPVTTRNAPKT